MIDFTMVHNNVCRRVKFERSAEYPDMEECLHKEFRELRRKGLKVKAWWFKRRAKKILQSTDPNKAESFTFSDGWFTRFKSRYKISLRRPTNTAQRQPSEKEAAIQEFHQQIRQCQLPESGDGPQEENFNCTN